MFKKIVDVKLVSKFDFKSEDGKKEFKGTKIIYEGEPINSDNKKGVEGVQLNSDRLDAFNDFPVVPGKYEIEFAIEPGKQGQVKMKYVSCRHIKQ